MGKNKKRSTYGLKIAAQRKWYEAASEEEIKKWREAKKDRCREKAEERAAMYKAAIRFV